jgi:hypothetical protein
MPEHMKKIIYFLLFTITPLNIFCQQEFKYSYADLYNSSAKYGIHTKDSNYVAIGDIDKFIRVDTLIYECINCPFLYDTIIYNLITSDILVVKVNNKGDTVWTRRFGNELNQRSQTIIETWDGGYILTANDDSLGSLLIKLDINGDSIWSTHLEYHNPEKVIEFENGFIILGVKSHIIDGQNDIYIQFITKEGNEVWLKYYGTGISVFTACLDKSQDIIIAGRVDRNIKIYKIDINGEIIWQRIFENEGVQDPVSILASDDGDYILLYNHSVVPIFNKQPRLLKFNDLGEKIWEKGYFDFTFYDIGVNLIHANYGGLLISGLLNSNISENTFYLLKTDDYGEPIWVRYIQHDSDFYIRPCFLQETYDNGFFLVGTNKYGELTIIKIFDHDLVYNVEYSIITAIDHDNLAFGFKLFPNPATKEIIVETDFEYADFSIIDIQGRVVFHTSLTSHVNYIDLPNFKEGIYLTRMLKDNNVYTGKLIISSR